VLNRAELGKKKRKHYEGKERGSDDGAAKNPGLRVDIIRIGGGEEKDVV